MSRLNRTIAIIGGGFCGTVLAADLLKEAGRSRTKIVLIEQRSEIGRGVAYGKAEYPYLLNVPASRMSVDSADPNAFARFASERQPELAGQPFQPRELYGEYLQDHLAKAEQGAAVENALRAIHARAEDIGRDARTGKLIVSLSTRELIRADQVVLACGDPPPQGVPALSPLKGHDRYVVDPYAASIPFDSIGSVLLVGTGLTMCDIAVAAASFNPGVRIHALSRHGTTPAVQSAAHAKVVDQTLRGALESSAPTCKDVLRSFRQVLRQTLSRGGDWRDAIGIARAAAPAVWRRMPFQERSRFLRHVRHQWDVHRHRVPAATAYRLKQLQESGQLQIAAGQILDAHVDEGASRDRVKVQFRPRHGNAAQELAVDCVINCSGAYGRIARRGDLLMNRLLRAGIAVRDPLGLGLKLSTDGSIEGAPGKTLAELHYVGPMLRGAHWEATAAGELRSYVAALAEKLRSNQRVMRPMTVERSWASI